MINAYLIVIKCFQIYLFERKFVHSDTGISDFYAERQFGIMSRPMALAVTTGLPSWELSPRLLILICAPPT